jgi:hypothetical protein
MIGRIARTLGHELRRMLLPTIFFLVGFNLIVLTVALLSDHREISGVSHLKASIGALLVGKAVLLAEMLSILNRYAERPLVYGTVWKASIYVLVAMAIHLAERLVSAATRVGGFAAGAESEIAGIDWSHFWAVQLWLVVLFFIYVGVRETIRALGSESVCALFFGSPRQRGAGVAGTTSDVTNDG